MFDWLSWFTRLDNSKIFSLVLFFGAFCGVLVYIFGNRRRDIAITVRANRRTGETVHLQVDESWGDEGEWAFGFGDEWVYEIGRAHV